ncbi:methyl-accepting chemotaxis protein [Simiduia sp. 21SJ11W-1]|uniref:methyl-accepting chemotaxis protein n=1 Tax=Simiduia sp. 21SJ11W-1 TaxID=2909669 RepID=UPI00209FE99B|nr:methyl-accepting chemotaxis protein [Simiduia sp. 21SJ11W-1]UTA47661.1 methyl-accepting chemotaxis protein [Simiduia sp. 21SJ11W-1]
MNAEQVALVRKGWSQLAPHAERASNVFLETVVKHDPSLSHLFEGSITERGAELVESLDTIISALDDEKELAAQFMNIGQQYTPYGVLPDHSPVIKRSLMETLEEILGKKFDDDAYLAWSAFYNQATDILNSIDAQEEVAADETPEEDDTMAKSGDNDGLKLLESAINNTLTAIMMVDRDLVITYVNKATMALFRKHEKTFQSIWPGFSASEDYMIGKCIDDFHKKPEHQRRILNDPSNLPYRTDIQVADLIIELNVSSIMGDDGSYIGCTLEWNDVTAIRETEDRGVRLQGAVDQSTTALMMVDRNFEITYMNQASLKLLKEHEAVFQKKWPTFRADESFMMGACIDMFHKNPAHQRKMLDDPSILPYTTDIHIEDLTFSLGVSAIYSRTGDYIGNCLEWSDVSELRKRQLEVGRLSSAVEGMTTNLMMADTKGNIVYMNPSVGQMLKKREAKIQTVLPSFRVDKIVGTNFDSFHKNPAHQQNLLGNPDNLPYQNDIALAGLEFNLTAIALRDSDGKHVGTAVQWVDNTEEKDAQRQIGALINAAIEGNLDKRIDTSSYEGFMKDLGDGINKLMDTIVEPVNNTIDIIQSLSQGDVSRNMDGEYGGQFLALSSAINESMNNLRNMVSEIRSASNNVFSAAREIAEGNNDLSQRTETQASNLEETASAMEELTTTVQQNAENASEATKLASGVMDRASNGGTVVKSAVQAMEDINRSSRKISDIIGVIDEIAFQTNLLALNAAVEAARAGEQGRGFAVVAAEVRNLAQRSAAAAKEIKGLINDSVEAVGKGNKLVDETGQTFGELVEAVKEVVAMISDIDSASKEQAAGINEISQAVAQMDEMTQQNAALVEEASASSRAMEDQAQQLLEQVSFFSTGEEDTQVAQASPRTKTTARRPANGAAARAQRPARAGGQAKASDEEWEEF